MHVPHISQRQQISRRAFLGAVTALAATAGGAALLGAPVTARAITANSSPARREFLTICDTDQDIPFSTDTGDIVVTDPARIRALEVATGQITNIDLPFCGHSVTQNPQRPQQLATFEKWGRRGALVDVGSRQVLALAQAGDGNTFFGHSAFSADGATLFTSEDNYARSNGQLTVRDAATLKIIETRPSYGLRPHECRSPDQGKTLVVMNGGTKGNNGSIVWTDFQSGQLLHKIDFSDMAHGNYAHLDFSHDGWICMGSAGKPFGGKIGFIAPDGRFLIPELPPALVDQMTGEALSIAFLGDSGLVAVTMPIDDHVIIIDYKAQKLVSVVSVVRPRGVVPDLAATDNEARWIVSSSSTRGLFTVGLQKGTAKLSVIPDTNFGGASAHMTRFYI